jgi:hypothetical protein
MSSGTQVDLDWAGADAAQGGAAAPPVRAANTGAAGGTYLTDEEILGIELVDSVAPTHSTVILSEAKNLSSIDRAGEDTTKRDSSGKDGPQNDSQRTFAERTANSQMPGSAGRRSENRTRGAATLARTPGVSRGVYFAGGGARGQGTASRRRAGCAFAARSDTVGRADRRGAFFGRRKGASPSGRGTCASESGRVSVDVR